MESAADPSDFGAWGTALAATAATSDQETVAVPEPDAAIRSRLNAAVLDGIVLGVLIEIVVRARGGATLSGDNLLLAYIGQFLYFAVCESLWGQTLGKRAYGIRVTSLDGSPASPRQIAIRNVLRFIDALPAFYASGLLSLMRTGSSRRQRIGDVAAGTTVMLSGNRQRLAPHRRLLPVATLIAVTLSVFVIIGAVHQAQQANASAPPNPTAPTAAAH